MSAASDEDPADGVTSSPKTQRMGIFKGAEAAGPDDPNSASQVVRRHLSATSPSPLYQ